MRCLSHARRKESDRDRTHDAQSGFKNFSTAKVEKRRRMKGGTREIAAFSRENRRLRHASRPRFRHNTWHRNFPKIFRYADIA